MAGINQTTPFININLLSANELLKKIKKPILIDKWNMAEMIKNEIFSKLNPIFCCVMANAIVKITVMSMYIASLKIILSLFYCEYLLIYCSFTNFPQYGQNLWRFSNWLKQLSQRITLSTIDLIEFVVLTVNISGISFKKLDSFPFWVIKKSLSFALVIAT